MVFGLNRIEKTPERQKADNEFALAIGICGVALCIFMIYFVSVM